LNGTLLEVEDDVGGVFNDARYRAEFVLHAFDADRGDGRAFDGARAARGASELPMVVPKPRWNGWAVNCPNRSVRVSVLATKRFGF
jgi:hypothetical protein